MALTGINKKLIMKNLYFYLYYRIYNILKSDKDYYDSTRASGAISFLITLNITAIEIIIKPLLNITLIIEKYLIIFIFIVVFIINYFCFEKDKNYLKIIKIFDNESFEERSKHSKYFYFYLIFSFILFLASITFKK